MTSGNVSSLFLNLSWRLVSKAEKKNQVTKARDVLHFNRFGDKGSLNSSVNFNNSRDASGNIMEKRLLSQM